MVILALTPTMVIPALTLATVIPEPTPIIHTPTGVGLVGVIRGAGDGVGVGLGSRLAGAGVVGGAVVGVGTAGFAADLLMPVSMAEGSGVAFTAVAVAAIVS